MIRVNSSEHGSENYDFVFWKECNRSKQVIVLIATDRESHRSYPKVTVLKDKRSVEAMCTVSTNIPERRNHFEMI